MIPFLIPLLARPKLLIGGAILVVFIGMGVFIKIEMMRITSLKNKLSQSEAAITLLNEKINIQNEAVEQWRKEAERQAFRSKMRYTNALKKAAEENANLRRILTEKISTGKEVEWANKRLQDSLSGF